MDEFTEVTGEQSYCDRMQASIKGVCIGALLFFGSWGVLFWNEGRAVKRQKDLDEGRGIVEQVGLTTVNATIDKTMDGKLIYVTGMADGGGYPIYDPVLMLDVTNLTSAIAYDRDTEMYQWVERESTRTEKTSGGGTRQVTTYSYDKEWRSTVISTSSFRQQSSERVNPTSFAIQPFAAESNDIGLGAYSLGTLSSYISWREVWSDAPVDTSTVNVSGYTTSFSSGTLYLRKGSGNTVGDNRATLYITKPDAVSFVAKQGTSGQLEEYTTTGGRSLVLFSRGTKTSDELFLQAEEDNVTLTWILRFVGFIVMTLGICMILNPISTVFDVLPLCGDCIGDMVGCMIFCIALCISVPLSLLIISIAWIFYRPYFAVGTLAMLGILGAFYWFYMKPRLEKKPSGGNAGQQSNPADDVEKREAIPAQPYGGETSPEAPKEDVPFGQALDNPPPSGGGGYQAP